MCRNVGVSDFRGTPVKLQVRLTDVKATFSSSMTSDPSVYIHEVIRIVPETSITAF